MRGKKCSVLFIFLAAILILTGCALQSATTSAGPDKPYLTIHDDAGRTVALAKKPERIVPLSVSYLDLLYAVGGQAVGKPSSQTGELPEKARQLPVVGHFASINTERLLELRPDLVIGYQGMHEKLSLLLETNRIPFLIVKMKTYDDVLAKIELFGTIAGNGEQAAGAAAAMEGQIRDITAGLPAAGKKAVILHATPGSVTVQLDDSIAGDIARRLGLKNIASDSAPLAAGSDATPYSLEKIVAGDPDVIFITFMGSMPDIQKRLQADVRSNPAWAGLRAVRRQQVFFLPMELFLLNPGIRYPEAVRHMARLVCPAAGESKP